MNLFVCFVVDVCFAFLWLIPHPIVNLTNSGSMECIVICMYVCMYVCICSVLRWFHSFTIYYFLFTKILDFIFFSTHLCTGSYES
jgi:hypothetical protein